MTDAGLLARSRILAKLALVSAAALVVLVLLLVFLVDHTTVSEVFLLVWGVFLLLAAIILGVALAYVFMTRGVHERQESVAPAASLGHRIEGTAAPVDPREGAVPEVALRLLSGDELSLYRRIVAAGGVALQKDLVRLGLFSGPKVSRILERLEAKGLIARERHGMTNRIRLSGEWRERA